MKLNYLQNIIIKTLKTKEYTPALELAAKCGLSTRELRHEIISLRSQFPIISNSNGYKLTYDKKEIESSSMLIISHGRSEIKTGNNLRKFL